MMNADGSVPTNLTNDPSADTDPSWSPNHTHIAFNRKETGIHMMNADGSGIIPLTGKALGQPSWSPDGQHIVFMGGDWGLYIAKADGSGVNSATGLVGPFPSRGGAKPDWSPDGTSILYAGSAIALINVDGSQQRYLTSEDSPFEMEATWSPDGDRIAFVSATDFRTNDGTIYVMNADGSGVAQLTTGPSDNRQPAWSPDGTQIAFSSNRDGNWEIYVMNADGSNPVNITNYPADDQYPSWGP